MDNLVTVPIAEQKKRLPYRELTLVPYGRYRIVCILLSQIE